MSLRIVVLAALSACGGPSGGPDEVANEETSSGAEAVVVETDHDERAVARVTIPAEPAAAQPADDVNTEASSDAPAHDAESEAREEMASELAALGAAMEAAQNATGATICETAYNGALAMVNALNAHSQDAPSTHIPTRAHFLSGCNQLPVEAQQCMTMQYAMANQASCGAIMQTPAVQAFRQSMLPAP